MAARGGADSWDEAPAASAKQERRNDGFAGFDDGEEGWDRQPTPPGSAQKPKSTPSKANGEPDRGVWDTTAGC